MVPGEACAESPEKGNRDHIRKVTLNAQESAEAIVLRKQEGLNQHKPE